MKIQIVGNGSFGSFLRELLANDFEIVDNAKSVILAVPISAYDSVAHELTQTQSRHLINVCSVQEPSTNTLLKYTDNITSIHPLFGRRTPADKRSSILTHQCGSFDDFNFIDKFSKVSKIVSTVGIDSNGPIFFTPGRHDMIMAKTHATAVIAAKQAKVLVERAEGIPDEFIPHSFRLLRDFVKTLDDMPPGTIESIMANPYA